MPWLADNAWHIAWLLVAISAVGHLAGISDALGKLAEGFKAYVQTDDQG